MTYTSFSGYYVPRSKKDLLAALLPTWKGKRTDLREMGVKRLRAIYHCLKQKNMTELMRK